MNLGPLNCFAQAANPVSLMGMPLQPPSSYAETMREAMARLGKEADGLVLDTPTRCLMLAPKRIPASMDPLVCHDKDGNSLTAAHGWLFVKDRTDAVNYVLQSAALAAVEWQWNWGASSPQTVLADGQGMWITFDRAAPHPDATRDPAHSYLMAYLMQDATHYHRIAWRTGQEPCVETTKDGVTWVGAGRIPIGDAKITGDACRLTIFVLRVDGKLVFRAGQSGDWNDNGLVLSDAAWLYPMSFKGMGANAGINVTFTQYDSSGTFTSAVKDKPWPTDSTPEIRIDGSPAPDAISYPTGIVPSFITQASPYLSQYRLTLSPQGAGYYATSPYVRQVHVQYPGTAIAPSNGVTWTDLPGLQSYEEEKWFDPRELSVNSRCCLTFRNRNASPANMTLANYSLYGQAYGMRAIRVFAGYGSDPALRFAGWCGHDMEGDMESFRLYGTDRTYPVRRAMMYNPPFFDGMCIYRAMYLLALRGGIHPSSLAVTTPGNPSDAWQCDGYSCSEDAGHIKMRRGTGMNPLMRFPDGTTCWNAMQEIRRLYGFAVGFDRFGYFRFYPWNPWEARDSWNPAQWFTAVPSYNLAGLSSLNEFLDNVTVRRSLEDTRNSLTLVGIDRDTWEPFAVHYRDDASVFGTGDWTSMPPPNFKGFIDSYVESSAMFVDRDFTDRIAAAMFNVMKQPRETHTIRAFGQDLDPLDYVAIDAHRMMTDRPYDKFFIGKTSATLSIPDQRYVASYECELIPYGLTANPFGHVHGGVTSSVPDAYNVTVGVGADNTPRPIAQMGSTLMGSGARFSSR